MNNTQESFLSSFFKLEAAGGIILMFAAVLAVVCANTPLQSYYALFLDTPVDDSNWRSRDRETIN